MIFHQLKDKILNLYTFLAFKICYIKTFIVSWLFKTLKFSVEYINVNKKLKGLNFTRKPKVTSNFNQNKFIILSNQRHK